MSEVTGADCNLYYQTTGTRATWGTADADSVHEATIAEAGAFNLALVAGVRDLNKSETVAEADFTDRDNNDYEKAKPTIKGLEVTFDVTYNTADASYVALRKAYHTKAVIALAVLDGLVGVEDTEGVWADFHVFGFDEAQPLRDAVVTSVTLKPAPSSVGPEVVRVTANP